MLTPQLSPPLHINQPLTALASITGSSEGPDHPGRLRQPPKGVRFQPAEGGQSSPGADNDGTNWDRRTKLTIAQPITYYPYFSAVDPDNVGKDEFTFTVSQRGLHLPANPLALVTPYPELVFTREVLVPCMHITEQAAEKAVGWTAAGLRKHYLDLAWIGDNHVDEIETPDFQKMTQKKLDAGYEAHGDAYEDYREWKSLLRPLMRPNDHVAPLKRDPTKRESEIRFIGDQPPLRWDQAIKIVQGVILKKLFGEAKAE